MLNSDLRVLKREADFKPFVMVLVTGERFSVPHGDFIWLPEGSRSAVMHYSPRGVGTFINTGMIVKIEFRGSTRRRKAPVKRTK